jgi:hypothetical protein
VVDDAGLGEVERRAGCDQLRGAGPSSFLQACDDRHAFHRFLLSAAATVGAPKLLAAVTVPAEAEADDAAGEVADTWVVAGLSLPPVRVVMQARDGVDKADVAVAVAARGHDPPLGTAHLRSGVGRPCYRRDHNMAVVRKPSKWAASAFSDARAVPGRRTVEGLIRLARAEGFGKSKVLARTLSRLTGGFFRRRALWRHHQPSSRMSPRPMKNSPAALSSPTVNPRPRRAI